MGLTQAKDTIPEIISAKVKQGTNENKLPDYHVSTLHQLSREELIKDNLRRSEEVQWIKQRYQELLELKSDEMLKREEKWKAELRHEKIKNAALSQVLTEDLNNTPKKKEYENILGCQNFQNVLVECCNKNPESIWKCSEKLKNFQNCISENKLT